MKNGSKLSSKQNASQSSNLGKREAPETRSKDGASGPESSPPKDMETELLRLMRENDKLKNQLSDSQGEVKRLKEVIECHESHKKAKQDDSKSQSRYWTEEEHQRFLDALQTVGPKDVKAIASFVGSRSATQVRTHAQKYFLKLARMKKCAEDAVMHGGAIDDTWWLQTDDRSASSGKFGGGGMGHRSPRLEVSGALEHMDSTSIQMLADLVAASPLPGDSTDGPYSLHREHHHHHHHRRDDAEPQYSLHREHHPRRSVGGGGLPVDLHIGKYASSNMSCASSASNGGSGGTSSGGFFMPDAGATRRGGGGSSASSESSSGRGSVGGSGGGVSNGGGGGGGGGAAARKDHHVHREWRDIMGDGGAHARGRGGSGDETIRGGGSSSGGGGGSGGGGLQSSSNEESGPTDGSSTHGNGTSNGSGNDSGSSNRSIRSSNHSSDGSRSSDHSSDGSRTPEETQGPPGGASTSASSRATAANGPNGGSGGGGGIGRSKHGGEGGSRGKGEGGSRGKGGGGGEGGKGGGAVRKGSPDKESGEGGSALSINNLLD